MRVAPIAACNPKVEPIGEIRKRFIKMASTPGASIRPHLETVKDRLLEAEWLGLVALENREGSTADLRVRKVSP